MQQKIPSQKFIRQRHFLCCCSYREGDSFARLLAICNGKCDCKDLIWSDLRSVMVLEGHAAAFVLAKASKTGLVLKP